MKFTKGDIIYLKCVVLRTDDGDDHVPCEVRQFGLPHGNKTWAKASNIKTLEEINNGEKR